MLKELEIRLKILDEKSIKYDPNKPMKHTVEQSGSGYRLISINKYGFEDILYNAKTQTEIIKYIDKLIGEKNG